MKTLPVASFRSMNGEIKWAKQAQQFGVGASLVGFRQPTLRADCI
jgi:hypothetical protein